MSKIQSGCNCDCMNCGDMGCSKRTQEEVKEEPKAGVKEEIKEKVESKEDKAEVKEETPAVEVKEAKEKASKEVVDELFFISEVKMKEADIEVVDLEQDNEEAAEDKDINDVEAVEETKEGGTNV